MKTIKFIFWAILLSLLIYEYRRFKARQKPPKTGYDYAKSYAQEIMKIETEVEADNRSMNEHEEKMMREFEKQLNRLGYSYMIDEGEVVPILMVG